MKRIITTSSFIFFLLLVSCDEDFLYKTDPTQIGADNFYKNQTQVEQALNGVYGQLQGIVAGQWLFNELPSDNTTVHYNPDDRGQGPAIEAFEYMTVNSGTGNIEGLYNSYYNAIFNINNTLAKLQNATFDEAAKKQIEGQLKFIRAYYYFNLVQYFGDVVIITEPLDQPSKAWEYVREPQEKAYALIESDLKDAVSLLPEKYNAANFGRATKGAALSLLGKVYLTKKQYADAVATLKQVLPLGYALLPSYADVFDPKNKNHVENIFDIQFQGGNDLGEHSSFIYTFAPRQSQGAVTGFSQSNPGGWNIPTKDMIAAYEEGDLRKDVSLKEGYTNAKGEWVPVPYINKYNHPHTIIGRTDDNWPVIRYADVLLMLAEAINEQAGPTPEAYDYLNQVRNRAGLASLDGLDKDSFRNAVLQERRVELAFENHRWLDLKRTKTPEELAQFLNAHGAREKADPTVSRFGIPFANNDYVFEPFEALYPIPNRQILINDKITQNPGY
jgi:hypothetical protein